MRPVPAAHLHREEMGQVGQEGAGVRAPVGVSIRTPCIPMLMGASAGAQEEVKPVYCSTCLPLAHTVHQDNCSPPSPLLSFLLTPWQAPGWEGGGDGTKAEVNWPGGRPLPQSC